MHEWVKEFPGAVIICDPAGMIIEMNDKAANSYAKDGGYQLVGSSLIDCHPEPARTKLAAIMATQQRNVYTIEKKGIRKLIYQVPWYKDSQYAGFLELSLELPEQMPHFVRG